MVRVGAFSGNPPPPPPPILHDIYGLLPSSGQVSGVSSGGLQGAGVNAHQPPDSLRIPPLSVHDSDYGGR